MGLGTAAALRRVAAWRSDAAVVFGSGLESLPAGATVDDELSYGELGWPSTAVPGHGNRLRLIRVPTAGGAGLRLALACGRPHGYECWSRVELERPVRDLVSAGAGRNSLEFWREEARGFRERRDRLEARRQGTGRGPHAGLRRGQRERRRALV